MSRDESLRSIEEELIARHRFRRERQRGIGRLVLPRFADLRYAGRLPTRRRATVGFAGVGARTRVRLAVGADDAARFTVAKHGWLDWLGAAFGLADSVRVDASGAERALLERRQVRDAIDGLFQHERADSLELAGGELAVLVPFFSLPPAGYMALLRQLDLIARHFDRVPLRVRVLKAVRRALSGEHGGTRCAYCHGGLSGEEEGLVACEECATVLHASCWHENARCPVLGCVGEVPESDRPERL